MVDVGDTVTLNQNIVEVETAKAAVEVPSPFAGVVVEIHHGAGETVDVGSPIITFDTDPSAGPLEAAAAGAAAGAAANPVESAAPRHASATGTVSEVAADTVPAAAAAAVDSGGSDGALIGEVGPTGRTATLVGYGPKSVTAKRRPRTEPAATAAAPAAPPPPARVSAAQVGQTAQARSAGAVVRAKPPVRKLAKDLGVDLAGLTGSGPEGSITRADVEAAASRGTSSPAAPAAESSYDPATRERRIPVKGVRKHTAAAMVASAFTAPHVTEFITLDMTPTMELRKRIAGSREFDGLKVTPLLFVAKALLLAVKRNPRSTRPGTTTRRRSWSRTTCTWASPAATPARADGAERQGRRRAGDARAGTGPAGTSPRPPRPARRRRPTCPAAPSPSPTSGCSASTTARRSSTPASRRSCASAPSARRRGCTTARSRSGR
jgi:pyruvate dehydrogenase E2 component (dihydrolipoamide acetyltransferase)